VWPEKGATIQGRIRFTRRIGGDRELPNIRTYWPASSRLHRGGLSATSVALYLALGTPAAATQEAPVPPLSEYFTQSSAGPVRPDSDGFIRRWLVLEPVAKPNPTNIVFTGSYVREALSRGTFPGDFDTIPRAGERAGAGAPLVWHALDSKLWDVKLFNFAQSLGKQKYGVVFWAVTVIDSPRE